jgi:alpha-tubulin suppressor-like RCC1 family protein
VTLAQHRWLGSPRWLAVAVAVTLAVAVGAGASFFTPTKAFAAPSASGILTWGYSMGAVDPVGRDTRILSVPVPVSTEFPGSGFPAPAIQVASGGDGELTYPYDLAVLSNGWVEAWGDNTLRELGNPSDTSTWRPAPQAVPGLTNITQVATEADWVMALGSDGLVRVWGSTAPGDPVVTPSPTVVPNLSNVVQIAATKHNAYALDSTGHVWMWGDNSAGQSGNAPSEHSVTSPQLVTQVTGAVQIAAEFRSAFAVLGDGTVMAWGDDTHGELGRGPGTGLIPGLTNVAKVFAGVFDPVQGRLGRAFAVLRDGTVMGWGDNEMNNLMDVTGFAGWLTPTVIPGLNGIRQIAVGGQFNVALGVNGSVTVWGGLRPSGQLPPYWQGSNAYGQYGDGTTVSSVGLHTVAGLSQVTQVAADQAQILALTADSSPGTFVPNSLGLSCQAATNQLQFFNLVASCDSANPAATVDAQSIPAGTTVRTGSTVRFTMRVTVPDVTGAPRGPAEGAIARAGLVEGTVGNLTDTRVCANVGTVASQSLTANTRVAPGAVMSLMVWVAPRQGCF